MTPTTSSGKPTPSRPNSGSRASQDSSPATSAGTATATATRPSIIRSTSSPSWAVTIRLIQCWSGNVSAAAANPHQTHSTDTGAAASAPSVRVTSAKKT